MSELTNTYLFQVMSGKEFADHIEEEDFFLKYGNPVLIREEGKRYACLAIELYERLSGTDIRKAFEACDIANDSKGEKDQ